MNSFSLVLFVICISWVKIKKKECSTKFRLVHELSLFSCEEASKAGVWFFWEKKRKSYRINSKCCVVQPIWKRLRTRPCSLEWFSIICSSGLNRRFLHWSFNSWQFRQDIRTIFKWNIRTMNFNDFNKDFLPENFSTDSLVINRFASNEFFSFWSFLSKRKHRFSVQKSPRWKDLNEFEGEIRVEQRSPNGYRYIDKIFADPLSFLLFSIEKQLSYWNSFHLFLQQKNQNEESWSMTEKFITWERNEHCSSIVDPSSISPKEWFDLFLIDLVELIWNHWASWTLKINTKKESDDGMELQKRSFTRIEKRLRKYSGTCFQCLFLMMFSSWTEFKWMTK